MVTIDTSTYKNMVVWQKLESPYTDPETGAVITIENYNLFRQDSAGLDYHKIAEVPYGELSVFVDTTSEPRKRPYKYKLSALLTVDPPLGDSFEEKSDTSYCWYHKTLFISKEVSGDSLFINVDPYEVQDWNMDSVFAGQQVYVYRGTDSTQLHLYDSVDIFFHDSTIHVDDPLIFDSVYYFTFALSFPWLVDPTDLLSLKASAGPFSQAISNLEDNRLKGGENKPPSDISLSNNMIGEDVPVGSVVGVFSVTDINQEDDHDIELVSGQGDTDNGLFMVSGDTLKTNASLINNVDTSYSVRVKATENNTADSYAVESVFTIQVNKSTGCTPLPEDITALTIYPNPYKDYTNITYTLKQAAQINITVYSFVGIKIAELTNQVQEPGTHSFKFSAKDHNSNMKVYLLTIRVNGRAITKKIFEY